MKKRVRLIFLLSALLFALLYLGRFAYLLLKPETRQAQFSGMNFQNEMSQSSSKEGWSRKNYASAQITIAQPSLGPQVIDQKYERVANLSSTSDSFGDDSKAVMKLAQDVQAQVQSENSNGLSGSRTLSLSFGVTPENFEFFVEELQKIGKLESVTVVKSDKTADYKVLEAKRLSLEKTRDGLRALKAPGAALSDLVALETKILEIEGQIQELGVSLGDFAEGNSFCTVNFSLSEREEASMGLRIATSLFDALGWSLLVFLGLGTAAMIALGTALLASLAVDKILLYVRKVDQSKKEE